MISEKTIGRYIVTKECNDNGYSGKIILNGEQIGTYSVVENQDGFEVSVDICHISIDRLFSHSQKDEIDRWLHRRIKNL